VCVVDAAPVATPAAPTFLIVVMLALGVS